MKDNTVNTNNVDVYINKIYMLVDEYLYTLSDDITEIKILSVKPPIFRGLLKYIYTHLFKPGKNENVYQNSIKRNSNLDYENIDLINNIWDIYTALCYKYLQIPTLLNFSIMTGISTDWFNDIKNGNIRTGANGASSKHCQSVKRWLAECEAGLYDGAATGNPGPMFLLKSNYGYSEQPQRIEVIGSGTAQQSREEIAAKYASIADKRPDMPEF